MSATKKYTAHVNTFPEATRVTVRLVSAMHMATVSLNGYDLTAHIGADASEETAVHALASAAARVLGAEVTGLYIDGRQLL